MRGMTVLLWMMMMMMRHLLVVLVVGKSRLVVVAFGKAAPDAARLGHGRVHYGLLLHWQLELQFQLLLSLLFVEVLMLCRGRGLLVQEVDQERALSSDGRPVPVVIDGGGKTGQGIALRKGIRMLFAMNIISRINRHLSVCITKQLRMEKSALSPTLS